MLLEIIDLRQCRKETTLSKMKAYLFKIMEYGFKRLKN